MKDFTLVVPTYNRHNFLDRLLEAYKDVEFEIIIVDASKEKYAKNLRDNVRYIHNTDPSKMSAYSQAYIGCKAVKTKYCSCVADDDYAFPSSIKKCLKFLRKNDDYTIAYGTIQNFINYHNVDTVDFRYVNDLYGDRSVEQKEPLDRIKQITYDNPLWILPGVQKTSSIIEIYECVNEIFKNSVYNPDSILEAIIVRLLLLDGKFKHFAFTSVLMELQINTMGTRQIGSTIKSYKKNENIVYVAISNFLIKKGYDEKKVKKLTTATMDNLSQMFSKIMVYYKFMGGFATTQILDNEIDKKTKKYIKLLKKHNINSGYVCSTTGENYSLSRQMSDLQYGLELFFKKHKNKKFIIYGAGVLGGIIGSLYPNNIKFFIDIKAEFFDEFHGKKLYLPKMLSKYQNIPIFIAVLGRENEIASYIKHELELKNEIHCYSNKKII